VSSWIRTWSSVPHYYHNLCHGKRSTVHCSTARCSCRPATVAELNDVLRRPRFDPYVHEDERLEFLAVLVRDAEVVEVTEIVTDCRDPKDNKFLQLALDGGATHIVSGDEDLLVLHPFRSIPILTPRGFVAQWEREEQPNLPGNHASGTT
jgi:putative PIN family toxin of toxin-antitoxin system